MRAGLTVAAILLAAGLVVSRPLVSAWTDSLPLLPRAVDRTVLFQVPGDTLQLYYHLWLLLDGVVGHTPLLSDPYQFRVDGSRWNLSFPPLALPFFLLSPLGPEAAYNSLVLLSFPLTGLAAYALARHYTGHSLAAAVAAVAFALFPARLGPLFLGQPAGFAAGFVPLVLWGLDRAVAHRRIGGGLTGGAAFLALAMLEPHYTYLMSGLVLAYAPIRWSLTAPPRRVPWAPLLAFGCLAAAGVGWLEIVRQVYLAGSAVEAGRSLAEVRVYAPGPAALLAPATYGGVGLLALALVGLATGGRDRAIRLFYGAVATAGLVLSLGPTLPAFPLYETLHRSVPLFSLIRNPEKFRLPTALGIAVLAAYGVRALTARLSPRLAWPVGGALLAVVLVDVTPWHPIAVTRFPDNPVYAVLRAEARRILYVPVWAGEGGLGAGYLYHATRTRVPMVNGYSPMVPRRYVELVAPLQSLNVGDLGPVQYDLLRRLGVTHVVLDRGAFPPQASPFPSAFTRDRLRASPALALEREADPLWLYRLNDQAPAHPPPATSPVGVFFEAEGLPREIGHVVRDDLASGGRGVAARAGGTRPGFLAFGPYTRLPNGVYRALFRARGSGLRVEVAVQEGRRLLAHRQPELSRDWVDIPLRFAVEDAQPVEFRVHWDGQGEATVDWVSVVFADRPEPEWEFEVEELPHLLRDRGDPTASGGRVGYADPAETRRLDVVRGPGRLYPAGHYRVGLWARAETPGRGPLFRFTASEAGGRTLAVRTVDAGELPPGAFREISLDFRLARPTVVEFPTRYLGGTGVSFDRLVVSPR